MVINGRRRAEGDFFLWQGETRSTPCLLLCILLLLLLSTFLHLIWRQFSVESACVSLFFVFRRIGEYISLDLFYFVNLTSSCSLISWILHTTACHADYKEASVWHAPQDKIKNNRTWQWHCRRVNLGRSNRVGEICRPRQPTTLQCLWGRQPSFAYSIYLLFFACLSLPFCFPPRITMISCPKCGFQPERKKQNCWN